MVGTRAWRPLVALAVVCLLAGCARHSGIGVLTPDAYQSRQSFVVHRSAGTPLALDDWRIENFDFRLGCMRPRAGAGWTRTMRLDADGDGVRETVVDVPSYELRLVRGQDGPKIWLRTVPVGGAEALSLSRAAESYVSDGDVVRDYAGPDGRDVPRARLTATGTTRVDGRPAFTTVAEVAPSGTASGARVMAVMVDVHRSATYAGRTLPVVLVAGYGSAADRFDRDLPDFQRFLSTIDL